MRTLIQTLDTRLSPSLTGGFCQNLRSAITLLNVQRTNVLPIAFGRCVCSSTSQSTQFGQLQPPFPHPLKWMPNQDDLIFSALLRYQIEKERRAFTDEHARLQAELDAAIRNLSLDRKLN